MKIKLNPGIRCTSIVRDALIDAGKIRVRQEWNKTKTHYIYWACGHKFDSSKELVDWLIQTINRLLAAGAPVEIDIIKNARCCRIYPAFELIE